MGWGGERWGRVGLGGWNSTYDQSTGKGNGRVGKGEVV